MNVLRLHRQLAARRKRPHENRAPLSGLVLFSIFGLVLLAAGPPTAGVSQALAVQSAAQEAILLSEFIGDKPAAASSHASTLAESQGVLISAWFAGTRERSSDTGIWISRRNASGWSAPAEVADGTQEDGGRFPSWNPVLFQSRQGPLLLFYRVGPNPQAWWTMLMYSDDAGKTWSKPQRLPEGFLGPIKNKPIELAAGVLLCPSSVEYPSWQVRMERTADLGRTWESSGPLNDGKRIRAIQPTVLQHANGRLQILCRSREGRLVESWSKDDGRTWTPMQSIALPNPNSGIDGVALRDGRVLLVYNHADRDRTPLNVAVSADGKKWQAALVLEKEPGEFSYPAVIQTSDGLVHISYTWKREGIKHVVIDPGKLVGRDMPDGRWPD